MQSLVSLENMWPTILRAPERIQHVLMIGPPPKSLLKAVYDINSAKRDHCSAGGSRQECFWKAQPSVTLFKCGDLLLIFSDVSSQKVKIARIMFRGNMPPNGEEANSLHSNKSKFPPLGHSYPPRSCFIR